jgi:hypothetical protein
LFSAVSSIVGPSLSAELTQLQSLTSNSVYYHLDAADYTGDSTWTGTRFHTSTGQEEFDTGWYFATRPSGNSSVGSPATGWYEVEMQNGEAATSLTMDADWASVVNGGFTILFVRRNTISGSNVSFMPTTRNNTNYLLATNGSVPYNQGGLAPDFTPQWWYEYPNNTFTSQMMSGSVAGDVFYELMRTEASTDFQIIFAEGLQFDGSVSGNTLQLPGSYSGSYDWPGAYHSITVFNTQLSDAVKQSIINYYGVTSPIAALVRF